MFLSILFEFPMADYISQPVFYMLGYGCIAVDLFFLLSGFVLSHVYQSELFTGISFSKVRHFLLLRLARIYPIHLTILICYALLKLSGITFLAESCDVDVLGATTSSCSRFSLEGLISHLTLTATWGWTSPLSWNDPAWSISSEWFGYLIFPILIQFVPRIRNSLLALVLSVLCMLALIASLATSNIPIDKLPMDSNGLLRIGFEFVAGMLIYQFYRSATYARIPWGQVSVATLVIAVALYVAGFHVFWVLPLAVPFLLSVAQPKGPISKFLSKKSVVWLGTISFPIYMGHVFVLDIWGMTFDVSSDEDFSPLKAAAMIAGVVIGTIGFAALLHYYIEEPSRRMLRRWISPKQSNN